jgi:GrpB-like predicted nucleotidyltransferase (UPF0157 family)
MTGGETSLRMLFSNSDNHWPEQFSQERTRVLSALGDLAEGGAVETLQHIGATSVPGLLAWPCIDIGLSVWPFPLEPHRRAALESLGYELISGHEGAPEQRFRHSTGDFQLLILEAGSELWTDYRIISDYLRHNEDAQLTYSKRKQEWAASAGAQSADYQTAKAQFFLATLDEARRWWIEHQGFAPVETVANELRGLRHAWHISSGWALDLFLGGVTRVHHDVDVVIPRADQLALREHMTARGWRLMTPLEGRLEPWPLHMHLELPRHQVHALRDGAFIDFLLSDLEHEVWRYRRAPTIIRSAERLYLRSNGEIPFIAPEVVLLFKSKNTSGKERRKDQADFERVYAYLEPERRAWLLWALLATDPEHSWIKQLSEGGLAVRTGVSSIPASFPSGAR